MPSQKKKEKKRYEKISKLPIMLGKCYHTLTLETLNINEKVLQLISNISWSSYFENTLPVYVEFYKKINFTLKNPNVVSF